MSTVKILLIEDDKSLSFLIADRLKKIGYGVETEANGAIALQKALENQYDLLIIDIMLPDKNGMVITQELRKHAIITPILMLTALSEVSDKVAGLTAGADDYLTKPFEMSELTARVNALIRRTKEYENSLTKDIGNNSWITAVPEILQLPNCTINLNSLLITRNNANFVLHSKEAELLACLIFHYKKIISREQLFEDIWGYASDIESRTVDMHISHLRQKLDDTVQPYKYIRTIRGKGYMWIYPITSLQ